jgi:trigger factor
MRQRFGKSEEVETVEVNDVIYGTFTQVDNQGNTVPQGHESTSHISVNLVKDEAEQKLLVGAAKDSRIVFNPLRGTGNETETAGLLNIKKDETELMQADYALTIQSITRMIPAELNEDFIKQIYPDSENTTVEALRERVRAEAESAFIADSDHLFGHHMQEKLLAEVQFSLPEAFMKRWILENNQGKISVEEMERDYSKYVDSMRWQLIENRIIIDGKIEVGDAEIKDTIKDYYLRGWRTMQLTDDLNNRLEEIATSHLKSKPEETRRILDSLYSQKVVAYVKSKVKLVEKEISYDEFMKIDAEKH